jgi:hypothetical protein
MDPDEARDIASGDVVLLSFREAAVLKDALSGLDLGPVAAVIAEIDRQMSDDEGEGS